MKNEKQKEERKERKLDLNNLLCACTGLPCDGNCREINLHRERNWSNPINICPEAFNERKKR